MSSRALRKLQREQEQQKQLDILDQVDGQDESEQEEAPAPKALNAFDMLHEVDDGDEDDKADMVSSEEDDDTRSNPKLVQQEAKPAPSEVAKGKSKSSKKKKTKKKSKIPENSRNIEKTARTTNTTSQLDEIDLALKSLSVKANDDASSSLRVQIDEANLQLYRLLAVESKHLNALNEMKRLFGNAVLENEDEAVGTPRRRGRGPQQLDLGAALAGRHSPASRGQGLAGLALRRNPFILGKEEWPKATSGGLGMEMVEKMEDGTIEYRFVHSTVYQDVQRQFETCVESMDPQRMIQMLQYNPYHISTLLQVSEIAKQQGDHSVSGDLLERALFSFGRAVHSSFTTALAEGKARLDFRRPENREFWLAAWRYTINLGQRGTWRTAYEWAKLILSIDPEGDPYCVALMIDQVALRGGQSEHFLQLSSCPFFREDLWKTRSNIQISSALAQYKLKLAQSSRATLKECINKYPWTFARLFQALNLDHIPKSIWGTSPTSEHDKFDCELYVHNAKDLWNIPEAISFLVEVAESMDPVMRTEGSKAAITHDEARHVLLSGVPTLINLIPRNYTSMPSSSSDPLPPLDNLPSYNPAPSTDLLREVPSLFEVIDDLDPIIPDDLDPEGTPNPRSPEDNERALGDLQELRGLQGFFHRFMPWRDSGQTTAGEATEGVERAAGVELPEGLQGIPGELLAGSRARLMELLRVAAVRDGGVDNNPEEGRNENGSNEASSPNVGAPHDDFLPTSSSEEQDAITRSTTTHPGAQEPYDEDRNQRWLAGQGLLRLREFTTEHGTVESEWPPNRGQDIVTEYATRMAQLRQQRTRNFILDYTLRQGTSQAVKDLISREMARNQR